ncbi:hypothetical protein ANRL4_04185 [Anaerolineae bacterium]|nr:hypothetical protein ANRL4_04185 [Anaerolineae bacterium]
MALALTWLLSVSKRRRFFLFVAAWIVAVFANSGAITSSLFIPSGDRLWTFG